MMILNVLINALVLSQAVAPAHGAADANLVEAAKLGRVAVVRDLLSAGARVNATDRRGFTPLMWASANGDPAPVRSLLDAGAAVDVRAHDGTTALLLAASNGFDEIARMLIARGASLVATRSGRNARQLAEERGHVGMVTLLAQAEALGARLLRAAAEGHDTLVRQLLASGAPANVTDERGATALMMSARNGDLGILQALISRGADAAARDHQGQGVLEWAAPSPTTAKYVLAFLQDRGVPGQAVIPVAAARSPQVKASLETLTALLKRVPSSPDAMRQPLSRANAAMASLRSLSTKWPAESPDDYRDNLANNLRTLDAALTAGDSKALIAAVESLADDLEIKLEHCTLSGGKLGGAVVVRVRTVHGSDEVKSWQVFYMPRLFEAAQGATPDLFPRLSSPTEEALVPGRYVMWVRDPTSSRLGERTTVKVGEGRKELLVDLPIPPTPPR